MIGETRLSDRLSRWTLFAAGAGGPSRWCGIPVRGQEQKAAPAAVVVNDGPMPPAVKRRNAGSGDAKGR